MKRITSWEAAIITLSLAALACLGTGLLPGGGGETDQPAAPAEPLTQTHRNESAGFSMDLPEGWVTQTFLFISMAAPSQATLEAEGPTTVNEPIVLAIVGPASDLAGEASSPEELADLMLAGLGLLDDDDQVTADQAQDLTIAGQPASAVNITISEAGETFEGRAVTMLGTERAGFFMAAAPQGQWADFAPTFDAIVASVQLFEPDENAGMAMLLGEEELGPPPGDEDAPLGLTDSTGQFTGGDGFETSYVGTLEVGGSGQGVLTDGFDANNWEFTWGAEGSEPQPVTITVRAEDENLDAYVKLIDAEGNVLLEDDDSGGGLTGSDPQLAAVLLPASGEYVIRVTAWGLDGGPYTVTLEAAQ